jgi:amidase
MMLNAMATGDAKTDYVAALDADVLQDARVGVMRFSQGSNADIIAAFDRVLETLEQAGATLVEIDEFEPAVEEFWGLAGKVLRYEFKATINEYLADAAPAVNARTLDELIAFNEENAAIELALFDQSIFEEAAALGDLSEKEYREALEAVLSSTRDRGIDAMLADHDLDILASPSGPVSSRVDPVNGDVWPDWAGGGYLAAIAGYPHVSVPMGTVHGIPIGVSFIGAKDSDAAVLAFGYAYEQRSNLRVEPRYLADAEAREEIAAAMRRQGPGGSPEP